MTAIQIVFFVIAAVVVFGLAGLFVFCLCRVSARAGEWAGRMARNMKGKE